MVTRRCPCGYETRATFRSADPRPDGPVITAEFYNSASESETAKWRSQLERKFEPAREKLPDMEEAQRLVDDMFRPEIPGLTEDTGESDSGQLERVETAAVDILDRPAGGGAVPADSTEPLMPRRPSQQALTLEPLIAEVKSRVRPEEDARQTVSKEILFSRVLAGILDLLVPVGTAVVFVFAACWFLRLDFFSPSATYSWLLLALGFYFFNSLYFFWSAGRTPGMSITDLQLTGEDSEDAPFISVVLRILLFLPVVATVVGLVLALFDSECRALHDRLSKTRIISG
ncbi:MAG: RDD family protein [Acidobacteria bacterium]|nr:MAG: RDD family protein [Acidobacteriota bacterium]